MSSSSAFGDAHDPRTEVLGLRQSLKQRTRGNDEDVRATVDEHAQRANLLAHDAKGRRDVLIRGERWRGVDGDALGLAMKEAQCHLEIGDRRIARRDYRDRLAMVVLQRGDEQRARLDRGAGDVDPAIGKEVPEKASARDAGAKLFDELGLAVQEAESYRRYGVK